MAWICCKGLECAVSIWFGCDSFRSPLSGSVIGWTFRFALQAPSNSPRISSRIWKSNLRLPCLISVSRNATLCCAFSTLDLNASVLFLRKTIIPFRQRIFFGRNVEETLHGAGRWLSHTWNPCLFSFEHRNEVQFFHWLQDVMDRRPRDRAYSSHTWMRVSFVKANLQKPCVQREPSESIWNLFSIWWDGGRG